jgi:hypothetical protein
LENSRRGAFEDYKGYIAVSVLDDLTMMKIRAFISECNKVTVVSITTVVWQYLLSYLITIVHYGANRSSDFSLYRKTNKVFSWIAALVEPKTRLTTNKKMKAQNLFAKNFWLISIVYFLSIKDSFNQQSTKARIVS